MRPLNLSLFVTLFGPLRLEPLHPEFTQILVILNLSVGLSCALQRIVTLDLCLWGSGCSEGLPVCIGSFFVFYLHRERSK